MDPELVTTQSNHRFDARAVTPLRGGRLFAARAGWAIVAAVAVLLSIVGQPALFDRFRTLEIAQPETRQTIRANLAELGLAVDVYALYLLALGIVLAVACFGVAAVIVYRRSYEPMALFVALMLVLLGATFSGAIGAPGESNRMLERLDSVLSALSLQSVLLLFFLFPDGRFIPRWTRWPAIISTLCIVPTSVLPGSPLHAENWPGGVYALFVTGVVVAGIVAQVYRYRRISEFQQRQQTKWVVLGFTVALLGYLSVGMLPAISTSFQPGTLADLIGAGAVTGFMLLIPLSFGIAILRYHLWDIDFIINRTLVYGLLTGLFLIVYVGLLIVLQGLFRALTGQSSDLAIIISTLAVAALFQPLRRYLQGFIDRRFYRGKYDADRTLSSFSVRLRHEIDLPTLTRELEAVVQQTMQPSSVSLWIRPLTTPSEHEPSARSANSHQRT